MWAWNCRTGEAHTQELQDLREMLYGQRDGEEDQEELGEEGGVEGGGEGQAHNESSTYAIVGRWASGERPTYCEVKYVLRSHVKKAMVYHNLHHWTKEHLSPGAGKTIGQLLRRSTEARELIQDLTRDLPAAWDAGGVCARQELRFVNLSAGALGLAHNDPPLHKAAPIFCRRLLEAVRLHRHSMFAVETARHIPLNAVLDMAGISNNTLTTAMQGLLDERIVARSTPVMKLPVVQKLQLMKLLALVRQSLFCFGKEDANALAAVVHFASYMHSRGLRMVVEEREARERMQGRQRQECRNRHHPCDDMDGAGGEDVLGEGRGHDAAAPEGEQPGHHWRISKEGAIADFVKHSPSKVVTIYLLGLIGRRRPPNGGTLMRMSPKALKELLYSDLVALDDAGLVNMLKTVWPGMCSAEEAADCSDLFV